MIPGYLAAPSREAQIERLLSWTARLRAGATAMPWAEPPPQPDPFDVRDAAEAEEFAVLTARRQREQAVRDQLTEVIGLLAGLMEDA